MVTCKIWWILFFFQMPSMGKPPPGSIPVGPPRMPPVGMPQSGMPPTGMPPAVRPPPGQLFFLWIIQRLILLRCLIWKITIHFTVLHPGWPRWAGTGKTYVLALYLYIHISLFHNVIIMSAYLSTGLMPNPVWPPSGIPIHGAPVHPSVPVAKPVAPVTQSVPVSSESAYLCISSSL